MLDLKNLQNNFDEVAKKLKNKKVDENILKKLAELFASLKKEKTTLEEFQAFQNKFSKELATAEDKESLKAKLSENKSKINEQSAKAISANVFLVNPNCLIFSSNSNLVIL